MLGFDPIAVTVCVNQPEELTVINETDRYCSYFARFASAHDLVDCADFGTFGGMHPFLLEL